MGMGKDGMMGIVCSDDRVGERCNIMIHCRGRIGRWRLRFTVVRVYLMSVFDECITKIQR